jgi:hypothetical protein
MSSSRLAQKKRHPAKNILHSKVSTQQEEWSHSDILTAIGLVIAVISILFSLTTHELRQILRLDRPPDPPPYTHLLMSYDGYQQAISDTNEMYIILFITWQSPVESPEGDFDGYVIFPSHNSQQCNITGSLSPINDSPYTHMVFECVFSDYSEDMFQGEVYPDGHISGTVTNSANLLFSANWHFFPLHHPDNMPVPQADEHYSHPRCPISNLLSEISKINKN